jgi:hypothetical protein
MTGIVDRTQDFLNKIRNEFINHQVDQPLTTYIDDTQDVGPNFPPGAKVRTGTEIKARGWCKITSIGSTTGALQSVTVPGIGTQFWISDLVINFRYASWTHGEKWVWPGGAFVNNEWNDLHPQGSVKAILSMQPQRNGVLRLECSVDPDHNDRPGHFIRDRVAPQMISRLDFLTENFTGVSVDT